MTKKRFVAIGVEWTDGFIQDHKDDKDLFSIKAVVDCLNEQHETIQCHKERIAILSELLDFADAIIDLSDNEKAKNTWANKNTQLNIEWKKVLLKYGV